MCGLESVTIIRINKDFYIITGCELMRLMVILKLDDDTNVSLEV